MNTRLDAAGAGADFWSFSLAFYTRPGVAAALLALQDEAGADINLILFALWFGLSGRGRLIRQQIDGAERAIGEIRREVIEPVRALRRKLKASLDHDIRSLREHIKAIEFEAEKAAQFRLAGLAGPVKAEGSDRLADAEVNLCTYLGRDNYAGQPAMIIRSELRRLIQSEIAVN